VLLCLKNVLHFANNGCVYPHVYDTTKMLLDSVRM